MPFVSSTVEGAVRGTRIHYTQSLFVRVLSISSVHSFYDHLIYRLEEIAFRGEGVQEDKKVTNLSENRLRYEPVLGKRAFKNQKSCK